MRHRIIAAACAAGVALALPSAAFAGDRDDARVAIAEAKAKLDLNEKNGISGEAADIQSRARMALDKAQAEFKKSDEKDAIAAAGEANSLAELAATTQQKQLVQAQTALAGPR